MEDFYIEALIDDIQEEFPVVPIRFIEGIVYFLDDIDALNAPVLENYYDIDEDEEDEDER